jgi:3-phenylpropionate/cinnamic acid dioxygenase small subunit
LKLDGSVDSERLRCLQDKLAIQELLVSYARSCDERDWRRYRSLFTPEAEIDYEAAYGRRGLRDEIAAWIEGLMDSPALQHTQHMLSNFEIEVDGDHGSGRADYLNPDVFTRPGLRELLVNGGIYSFKSVRTDGGWRFRSFTARILWSAKGRLLVSPLS